MTAVFYHNLEGVKELGKLEGTNFRTKDDGGQTLLDMAKKNDDDEMIKYLVEKEKKETLAEKAAYQAAKHLNNEEDVSTLEIPRTLYSLITKFLDF